jgi:hypothetical protein
VIAALRKQPDVAPADNEKKKASTSATSPRRRGDKLLGAQRESTPSTKKVHARRKFPPPPTRKLPSVPPAHSSKKAPSAAAEPTGTAEPGEVGEPPSDRSPPVAVDSVQDASSEGHAHSTDLSEVPAAADTAQVKHSPASSTGSPTRPATALPTQSATVFDEPKEPIRVSSPPRSASTPSTAPNGRMSITWPASRSPHKQRAPADLNLLHGSVGGWVVVGGVLLLLCTQ